MTFSDSKLRDFCRRHQHALAVIALCLFAVFRLYLTADRDIDAWNAPHDEFWYVHKAYLGIWAGRYDEMSFVHLPTFALWLELLNTYGIPARMGIEFAWIGAVLMLADAILRLTGRALGAVAAGAFLLLHPYSVYIFDRSLAETLLAVTIAATVAAAIRLWLTRADELIAPRLGWSLALAGLFAVSCNLRKEGVTLLAPALLLGICSLAYRRVWWTRTAGWAPRLGVSMFVLPVLAALAMGWAFSTLNYRTWGTFVAYDLDNPGYKAAIASLAEIDTGRTPAHVSITREMVHRAYSASPTFRELEPQLSGAVARQWTDLSTSIGAQGEIGTGWFYWALRDAAARTGWHSSPLHAEAKYRAVADELRRAFGTGVLKQRRTWMPSFVDPDVGKWAPDLPRSFMKMGRLALLPATSDVTLPPENARDDQFNEYVRVVGRRNVFPVTAPDDALRIGDAYQPALAAIARWLGVVSVLVALCGLILALVRRTLSPAAIVSAASLGFGLSRVALFAILDASSWNGEQARYMLPLLPLVATAGAAGLALFGRQHSRHLDAPTAA